MYLILSKQKLNKNVLVDISEPHFFQSNSFPGQDTRAYSLFRKLEEKIYQMERKRTRFYLLGVVVVIGVIGLRDESTLDISRRNASMNP